MQPKDSVMFRVNAWYFIPFFLWVIFGFVALLVFDTDTLFRFFNGHYTARQDAIMPYVTNIGEPLSITLYSLFPLLYKRWRNMRYVSIALVVPLVSSLVIQWLKNMWNQPRPLSVYADQNWVHYLPTWDALYHHSLPSGHTSAAFSLFTMLAMLLPNKWKLLGLHFFIIAAMVAYSRMYLAAHFFEDVYVGSIVGTVLSFCTIFILDGVWQKKYSKS